MVVSISQGPLRHSGHDFQANPDAIVQARPPTGTDRAEPAAQWVDTANNAIYGCTGTTANVTNWELLGSATGAVGTINSTAPVAGNYVIAGTAEQVTVTDTAGTSTLSLPDGVVRSATVTMTNAEVKALATTPIELVAAPDAGSAIQFLGAVLKMTYGETNVFTETGDNLGIKYENAAGFQVCTTIECTGFIDAAASTMTNAVVPADLIVASASAEAKALVLDNLGSNFAGNAANDNTLSVTVAYRIVTL